MNPVDGGAEDAPYFGPPADGDDVPAGGSHRAGRLRGPLASPWARAGALAVVALGLGLLFGGLFFNRSADTVAAPEPAPTVTVTAAESLPEPEAIVPAGAVPDPTRLIVPSLGIDQGLIDLVVGEDGKMGVPATATEIGWWEDGPAPGEPGGALLAAHVNLDGERGVFADLGTMKVGEEVVVDREDGTTATYAVSSVEQFPKDDFPDERVYTYEGPTQLRLVTCGGTFNRTDGRYNDNIVVFADLVSDTREPAGA